MNKKVDNTYCVRCEKELSHEYVTLLNETDPIHVHELLFHYCPMVRCELYKVYQHGLEKIELSLRKDNWII